MWRQDTSRGQAQVRSGLPPARLRWELEALVCQYLSVAQIAQALAVPGTRSTTRSWKGAGACWSTIPPASSGPGLSARMIPPRAALPGWTYPIVWLHTRGSDRFVTVVVDLAAVR